MKIYFDNAATTKILPEVLDYMIEEYNNVYGNPSSTHSIGKSSKYKLENARNKIAEIMQVNPRNIIFTSSATEANNMALCGILTDTKNHIITSDIEHPSIYNVCKELEKKGYEITFLKTDKNGLININELENSIKNNTALISIMFANNETGVIQDIERIGSIAKKNNIPFHTDAVQVFGKKIIDIKKLNINMMSVSGHKLYAPKGVGFLYIDDNTKLNNIIIGGHQEKNRRAGTENLHSILALAKSIEILYNNIEKNEKYISNLMDYLIKKLEINFKDNIKINGDKINKINNIINISIKGSDIQSLLALLDMNGIAVSAGSACMAGSLEPSRILSNMNLDNNIILSSIRISLGLYNTKEEIDKFIEILKKIG